MSILFTPLGVLLDLLWTEPKPVFNIETTRRKLLFEFSAGFRLCGFRQDTQRPWTSDFSFLIWEGREISFFEDLLCARYCFCFRWNYSKNKVQEKHLDIAAYLGSMDHRKQEWGSEGVWQGKANTRVCYGGVAEDLKVLIPMRPRQKCPECAPRCV